MSPLPEPSPTTGGAVGVLSDGGNVSVAGSVSPPVERYPVSIHLSPSNPGQNNGIGIAVAAPGSVTVGAALNAGAGRVLVVADSDSDNG